MTFRSRLAGCWFRPVVLQYQSLGLTVSVHAFSVARTRPVEALRYE
jgi:hypothetical protein